MLKPIYSISASLCIALLAACSEVNADKKDFLKQCNQIAVSPDEDGTALKSEQAEPICACFYQKAFNADQVFDVILEFENFTNYGEFIRESSQWSARNFDSCWLEYN